MKLLGIFLSLFLSSFFLFWSSPEGDITITGLKGDYRISDTVVFNVTNHSDHIVFVSFNLERIEDGKSIMVKEDIFTCFQCAVVRELKLAPFALHQVIWASNRIDLGNERKLTPGCYRFGLSLRNEKNKSVVYIVSDSFYFK